MMKMFIWLIPLLVLSVVPDSSWSKPSPIGIYSSLIGVDYTEIHKSETDQAYDRRSARNYTKPFGYPNLPFPYAPLGGAVAVFIGVLLSNRGIERGPLTIWLCGWFALCSSILGDGAPMNGKAFTWLLPLLLFSSVPLVIAVLGLWWWG